MIYVVKAGDTLATIAAQYGISAQLLANENGLSLTDTLVIGQALLVLQPDVVHTVSAGEILPIIQRRYQVSANHIYRLNPWLNGLPDIFPGQEIIISYKQQPTASLMVTGYAYPSIPGNLLRRVLPYLSVFQPFTWGFTEQGTLIPPGSSEVQMLAGQYNIPVLLVLAPLNAEGQFNNALLTTLFQDNSVQTTLLSDLTKTVAIFDYAGVDLDFEYVREQDSAEYVAFAAELALIMHKQGRLLFIALAPKYFAEQEGLLYEGHDYNELGAIADFTLLMTYEWGYTYGPPMAVSPIQEVERVIDYGLSEIPAEKILMGISNYGYNWTLPYDPGRAATSISPKQAVDLARQYGATINYDETAQAPYFHYTDEEGLEHTVWFEDVRSIQARLQLAIDKGIRGVSYWSLDREFTANWLLLASMVHIEPLPSNS